MKSRNVFSLAGRTFENTIAVSSFILLFASCVLLNTSVSAQDHAPTKDGVARAIGNPEFSPYAGRGYPTKVMWGDTHLHTAISVDAGTMCRLGQEEAFRFARGEEVVSTHGLRVKLSRPLDYIVVSDHAEMYGLMPQLLKGDPNLLATGERTPLVRHAQGRRP